jgi:hypothetical protein
MNIEHSKDIPISEILSKLNIYPKKTTKSELIYLSPLREEKTPSFYVNIHRNIWFDHGEGVGGGLLKFAQSYLKSQNKPHTEQDAIHWIKELSNYVPDKPVKELSNNNPVDEISALVLKSKGPIKELGLIRYLEKRGIPLSIANPYLKELHIQNTNTGSSFYTLGFPNENNGYELRNPFFKGCLRPKTISFIRGRVPKPDGIHLFEGFMDFLSVMTQLNGRRLKGDCIVLNSVSCLSHAFPYIQNYGYKNVFSWMDNNESGEKATQLISEFVKTEQSLRHVKMNKIYARYEDVNAWHMRSLELA